MARRLADLPVLSARFGAGDLSLDQVDAISRMATADTEAGLIEEALGLSNTMLDRKTRRSHPPTVSDERDAHRVRGIVDTTHPRRSVGEIDRSSTQH